MVEKEYKKLITYSQYQYLCHLFKYDEKVNQINFYYMNNNIYGEKTTIRLRSYKDRMVLQIKEHLKCGEEGNISKEYEKEISYVPYMIQGEELNCLYKTKEFCDVYLVGYLVTERWIKSFENFSIVLDKSTYLGKVDYELELEYVDNPPNGMIKYLKENGVDFNTCMNVDNKFKRYWNRHLITGARFNWTSDQVEE